MKYIKTFEGLFDMFKKKIIVDTPDGNIPCIAVYCLEYEPEDYMQFYSKNGKKGGGVIAFVGSGVTCQNGDGDFIQPTETMTIHYSDYEKDRRYWGDIIRGKRQGCRRCEDCPNRGEYGDPK